MVLGGQGITGGKKNRLNAILTASSPVGRFCFDKGTVGANKLDPDASYWFASAEENYSYPFTEGKWSATENLRLIKGEQLLLKNTNPHQSCDERIHAMKELTAERSTSMHLKTN
jgi:hypothetical protein